MINFLPMAGKLKNQMRIKTGSLIFLSFAFFIFLAPRPLSAAENKRVILSYDFFNSSAYKNSPVQWQIFYNEDENLYDHDQGLFLKSDGDLYLVYPVSFDYGDYDRLNLTLFSSQPLEIKIIPDVTTTGYTNYELAENISAGDLPQKISTSLRLKFFKKPVENIGLRLISKKPADIVFQEISLEKMSRLEILAQGAKDYFRIAPHDSFTVNLFPTPRIWGRSALVYWLPFLFFAMYLFFYSFKWRRAAAIFLLAVWLIIDFRMTAEFFYNQWVDYQSFVKPPAAEKSLRNYGDFYQFADWLKETISGETAEINYYGSEVSHYPRLLQYLAYPLKVNHEGNNSKIFVFYKQSDIGFDPAGKKIYKNGQPLTGEGEIIAAYPDNYNSFIFQEK
ncbi:MAG: hypothetical protein A3J65_00915 [Candidatus Buchananbacteria bacterium RIFCSPHIGHO2_02_FULL_45_11b]|uniref:Uncharacterized protein n=3 Tax=Candidatus Buchananiibacteriota TaxID=1817903 RepID=A0A1G1Y7H8_9BACT|nr:MAG: hypothetical protein A2663_02555 [Candidatus Buchananbacteria bacterium RIFCSPHIGHO2_01_FULL_46_12]OGY50736.1 MAG: hypothetical protein A3J65_00915 [Candidatus Buchananbacteria bacterium RIFCSPHIGHO2_02_FULL_45_11b]OGY56024.1 MAG: hypothetical protein A3H67_02755 [Candidatus Buchananbacteria bacterium RIFCSPLOWO2_02_FULL_46_11b]